MSPRPFFLLVGGINGAGKSTFIQDPTSLRIVGPAREFEIINPDLLTRAIQASAPSLSLGEANLRAAIESEVEIERLVAARTSFATETVLSTDKYKPVVKRAIRRGYEFLFVYVVLTSPAEAIERVRIRVSRGGHDVPKEKIRERWPRSLANLPWFFQMAHRAWVVFNGSSVDEPFLMAKRRGPVLTLNLDAPAPWAIRPLVPRF